MDGGGGDGGDGDDGGAGGVPLGVRITPGEVMVPPLVYETAPIVVTAAAFGGHGLTAADPIVISGRNVRVEEENTAAVWLQQPGLTVTIENCVLVGRGRSIISAAGAFVGATYVDGGGARLIVRNNRIYGLDPLTDGHARSRFLSAGSPVSLIIEHNYAEHVSGIYVPDPHPGEPFHIRYNKVKDLESRMLNKVPISSGNGGEHGEGHFVALSGAGVGVPDVEIAWNEMVAFPDESASGDHVNLYNMRGTPGSPVEVHHNLVVGGYPYPASVDDLGCIGRNADGAYQTYTGSGMTTDGPADPTDPDVVTAYINFHHNRIVNTCTGGINLVVGHHTRAFENRVVHSGALANAARTPAFDFGVGGPPRNPQGVTNNNEFDHNTYWFPKAGWHDDYAGIPGFHDNIDRAAELGRGPTGLDELAEYDDFLKEAQTAGFVIGLE